MRYPVRLKLTSNDLLDLLTNQYPTQDSFKRPPSEERTLYSEVTDMRDEFMKHNEMPLFNDMLYLINHKCGTQ